MKELLERADPAAGYETDVTRLRALVEERIGVTPMARPEARRPVSRSWVIALTTFAVVLTMAIPTLLNRRESPEGPPTEAISELPGVESVIPLPAGGVQTMAVVDEDVWVVTALARKLQRVSISSNRIEETFDIDGHVEGVIAGDGYLWLLSYDNEGEVLRFDPSAGVVDQSIPLGGLPNFAFWYGGRLFVNTDQGEYLEISSDSDVLSRAPGTVRGEGFGALWVYDHADGWIRSIGSDGSTGEYEIPGSTAEFGDLGQVRLVEEAGGYLWLIFGDNGESVGRFDPATGELQPFHVGRWLHAMDEHDGALWTTSYSDHLLFRVDPESGEVRTFALPGRPGGVLSIEGDLWVLLNQPGSLVRIDPSEDLLEMGPEIAATTSEMAAAGPHTLVCTLGGVDAETLQRAQDEHDFTVLGPTIVMTGPSWISGGIWSVVQAQVEGRVVCVSGHEGEGGTPEQRAADLATALEAADIPGPYQLVAGGDGVHTIRLFADGRDDVSGVVLVEPIPVGFQEFSDGLLGEEFSGHPGWLDFDRDVSDSLNDFDDLPLVVLSHDPNAVFLREAFVDGAGAENAQTVSDYWEAGISFYTSLSTDSRLVSVPDTGFDGVLWFRPDMIADEIMRMAVDRQ